jgi:hypothetical protein
MRSVEGTVFSANVSAQRKVQFFADTLLYSGE